MELSYPRVYGYTLASKAPLSVHGVCALRLYLSNAHALSYKVLDLGTGDFVYMQLASCLLLIDHVMLQLCQVLEVV